MYNYNYVLNNKKINYPRGDIRMLSYPTRQTVSNKKLVQVRGAQNFRSCFYCVQQCKVKG